MQIILSIQNKLKIIGIQGFTGAWQTTNSYLYICYKSRFSVKSIESTGWDWVKI